MDLDVDDLTEFRGRAESPGAFVLVLSAHGSADSLLGRLKSQLSLLDGELIGGGRLADSEPFSALWCLAEMAEPPSQLLRERLMAEPDLDFAILHPDCFRRKRLLVCDMDSTIIGQECIDELADALGLREEIAAITERAMRGELGFESALEARVARLKGLALSELERTYRERITLNPGARALVATMKAHGAHTLLVSGGFTFFTRRVAEAAGFAAHQGNVLRDDGAALTGEVARPILGREAKRAAMQAAAGVSPHATVPEAIALGDGANDLDMIRAAGIGVAYKAKPVVAAEARAVIRATDLRAALFFQGYRASDLTEA
jgi:phosphoserine phosphatase